MVEVDQHGSVSVTALDTPDRSGLPHDRALAAQIAEALGAPDRAVARLSELEARWDREDLVAAMRAAIAAPALQVSDTGPVGLVTGSGGMAHRIPNVSTIAAIAASCVDGVVVAKPGSLRSRTRIVGPAGLAARLGLRGACGEDDLRQQLARNRFAIITTNDLYPWLHLPDLCTLPFVVDALDLTALQPCTAHWKVNGVIDNNPVLHGERCRSGHVERCLIVHGKTDSPELMIDDASTAGTTELLLFTIGMAPARLSLEPEDVGLARSRGMDLLVPDELAPEHVFTAIVTGEAPRAWIELCALATSVILVHARAAVSFDDGVRHALALFRTGEVAAKVQRLRSF
jgi:anthranilate phosphoribosyltransferase